MHQKLSKFRIIFRLDFRFESSYEIIPKIKKFQIAKNLYSLFISAFRDFNPQILTKSLNFITTNIYWKRIWIAIPILYVLNPKNYNPKFFFNRPKPNLNISTLPFTDISIARGLDFPIIYEIIIYQIFIDMPISYIP